MYCFTSSRFDWLTEKWAALPLEVGVIAPAFLQPEIGDAFQFLHPLGLREGASEAREQMVVVVHAADEEGWAIELFGDAAEIRIERVARGFVTQERSPVFGGENEMNGNGGFASAAFRSSASLVRAISRFGKTATPTRC